MSTYDPLLERQLAKVGLVGDALAPSREQFAELLERVSVTYARSGEQRDQLARLLDVSKATTTGAISERDRITEVLISVGDALSTLSALARDPVGAARTTRWSDESAPDAEPHETFDRAALEWTEHLTQLLDSDELTDGESTTVRAARALNRGFLSMLDALGASLRAVQTDRRLNAELVEAQRMVLPASDVWLGPDLVVAGSTQAAGTCGGDFWVTLPIGRTPRVAVLVGDVTGHGVPSTVIAAAVRGALEHGRNLPDCTLGTLFDHAAAVVHAMGRGQLMMTLAGGLFDPERSEIVFGNAGHRLPLLIRGADTHPIVARGSPLGAAETSDCEFVTWPTRPDDVVCIYSDGMVEFDDPTGIRFSERRLRAVLAAHHDPDPRRMRDGVLTELGTLRGGRPRTDDITLVLARVTGPVESA